MLITILIFVAILGVLVFVHELGHFTAAKRCGIRVDEFGFGFPPRIFGIKRGETLYSLNWIPLGGFVKMPGEIGQAAAPDYFSAKPAWQRLIVLVAGVAMNFLLAFLIYTSAFMIGLPQLVDEQAPVTDSKMQNIAIIISEVSTDSSAAKAGIQSGDQIISIDQQKFNTTLEIQNYLTEHNNRPVTLSVVRTNKPLDFKLQAEQIAESDQPVLGVGLVKTGIIKYNLFQAIIKGAETTWAIFLLILYSLGMLLKNIFTGAGLGADISGPLGVAVMTGQVVDLGFVYVLNFIAILSINLGIINILPFPALDGGRVLFILIEKIKGSPVNERIETLIHNLGFSLLIILIIFITFKDLGRYGSVIWQGLTKLIGV